MSAWDTHRLSYPGRCDPRARRAVLLASGAWVTLAAFTAGCAGKPAAPTAAARTERTAERTAERPPEPATPAAANKPVTTSVELTLHGEAGMNPDGRGRASPLVTRIYALKSPASFELADFFTLFEHDAATLGSDLIRREERLLRPGAFQRLEWQLPPEVTAIGLIGAYRDLGRARWRQVIPIRAGQPQQLTAAFGPRGILAQQR